MRPIRVKRGFTKASPGSVLFQAGETVVLCTASIEARVPPWLEGAGKGWITSEYSMLPHSTSPRKRRDRGPKMDGRTSEIQRLVIGGAVLKEELQRVEEIGKRELSKSLKNRADQKPSKLPFLEDPAVYLKD